MKLARTVKGVFARLFHTRNIIIISPHRTNHLSISGSFQVLGLLGATACIGWASYSTGSYFAARDVLQAKDETAQVTVSPRHAPGMNSMASALSSPGVAPQKTMPMALSYAMPLNDPTNMLSPLTDNKLYARIALLETRVKELRSTNAEIIQAVREKTHNKIISMEEIIRQTGLNEDVLKKTIKRERKEHETDAAEDNSTVSGRPQGGPFIAAEAENAPDLLGDDLAHKIDQMVLLNDILAVLPLGAPLRVAEQESPFGRRVDPLNGRLAFHPGLDLAGPYGAPVYATAPGVVASAGWLGAYGNAVDIDHALGITTRYAHMRAVHVHAGQVVQKGQVIGFEGSTGRSTGPHVHYEVRYNDKPIDPVHFLHAGENVSQIN